MAAATRADLIAITEKEFEKLQKVLDGVDKKLAVAPHPDDGITIKDTLAHRIHWIDLFFNWYEDGVAGKPVYVPAKGYKWNQLKEYNAKVREKNARMAWSTAKSRLAAAHKRLMDFIAEHNNKALYGPIKFEWQGKWPLGRWIEASGASHYRSAVKYIREIKRSYPQPAG